MKQNQHSTPLTKKRSEQHLTARGAGRYTDTKPIDTANTFIMKRGNTELYEALREIENIEDELHAEDHPLAERLSDARMQLNGTLTDEAIDEHLSDE